jgi:O-antigen ligase
MHAQKYLAGLLALSGGSAMLLCVGFSDETFDRYQLPKEAALALLALGVLGALRGRLIARDAVNAGLLGFALSSGVSALFASSPRLALRELGLTGAACVLFLGARRLATSARLPVLAALTASLLVLAVLVLAESFGALPGWSRPGLGPSASLGQRNAAAHVMLVASPVAWYLGTERSLSLRALSLLTGGLTAAALVYTRSRAAWLIAPIPLVLFVALLPSSRRLHAALVALVVLGAALLAPSLPTRLAWRSPTPYADSLHSLVDATSPSASGRLLQWRTSLTLLREHPWLGVGPGNWRVEYPRISPPGDPTLQRGFAPTGRLLTGDLVGLLAERGSLGCAALFALLVAIGRQHWLERKSGDLGASAAASRDALPGAAALAGSVLAAALGLAAFDAVLSQPGPLVVSALTIGMTSSTRGEASARVARVAVIPLALLLVWTSVASTRALVGLWWRTRPGTGLEGLERAVAWNPDDTFARFWLSELYMLKGRCDLAEPHLRELGELVPHHAALHTLRRSCGNEARRSMGARPRFQCPAA